ncbi:MAG TPA: universal stress protein [Candidatus Acidoferrales bacterium]|nr:universal stress protein [Candidatus Acidoferrales bacterium]
MKILLAVDGSKFSEAAMRMLASQIRPQDAEVLVLQVVKPILYSTPPQMSPGYAPELAERRKERVAEAEESVSRAAQALRTAGFKVTTRVGEGEVRSGILDVAAEWGAGLFVLGSHGRTGLQRMFLGSVAEAVARHAHCSVLIARMGSTR